MVLFLMCLLLPRTTEYENFGEGSMQAKFIILGVASFFSVFIAGFRMGTTWSPTRMASTPVWYDSKEAFYIILFVFEMIIIYLFLLSRFDLKFWVPNGSNKPGGYSRTPMIGKTSEQENSWEMELGSEQTNKSGLEKGIDSV